jgi:uncharacterized membrane protein YhaH (DUF805 family)
MSAIVTAQQTTTLVATPSRTPRPRLWAVVGALLGVPLGYYGLAVVEGVSSSTAEPPASWPVTGTVVIAVAAAGIVAAVVLRRWRVAIALAALLALPWAVIGLTFSFAFGMGLLLLPPALVWVPSLVTSARALAAEERAGDGPSERRRTRRAAAWVSLDVLVLLVLVVVGGIRLADAGWPSAQPFDVFYIVAWVFLALALVGSIVLLALIAARRWRAAAVIGMTLGLALAASFFVIAILGLGAVSLLGVPMLLGARNLAALVDAERLAARTGSRPRAGLG